MALRGADPLLSSQEDLVAKQNIPSPGLCAQFRIEQVTQLGMTGHNARTFVSILGKREDLFPLRLTAVRVMGTVAVGGS